MRDSLNYKQILKEKTKEFGDPDMDTTKLGPLVDRAQFDRVQGFVDRETKRD